LLRRCVEPIVDAGADVVVLGCSHYPFIRPLLERIVGRDVRIIEPSDAIALQTLRILDREGLLTNAAPGPGVTRFATSGDTRVFDASVFRLVGLRPGAEALVWDHGRLGVPSTAGVI
ncbi:MAG: glutamate racemase, partial [Anaerolineae bacterium]